MKHQTDKHRRDVEFLVGDIRYGILKTSSIYVTNCGQEILSEAFCQLFMAIQSFGENWKSSLPFGVTLKVKYSSCFHISQIKRL